MPKVSVIMGVYNCKKPELLRESVLSIINQTYTNWEFLICDDGSTNNTMELLNEISNMDSRIKILHYDENHGLGYALNFCIERATGEIIARQDDDDISKPERFAEEISILNSHPEIGIVGTLAKIFDDDGEWGNFKVPENPKQQDFYWNSPFIHPTVMIRKSALLAVHGYRIARETKRCEDFDMFMRMYANGTKGYNIQNQLYLYRVADTPYKKYRPMMVRIEEAVVRYKGYKQMKILAKGIPYVIKPVLVGLIPAKFINTITRRKYVH